MLCLKVTYSFGSFQIFFLIIDSNAMYGIKNLYIVASEVGNVYMNQCFTMKGNQNQVKSVIIVQLVIISMYVLCI